MNKQASEHSSQIASLAALVEAERFYSASFGSEDESISDRFRRSIDHEPHSDAIKGQDQSDMASRACRIDSSPIHHASVRFKID
jgi:hypothetical protein